MTFEQSVTNESGELSIIAVGEGSAQPGEKEASRERGHLERLPQSIGRRHAPQRKKVEMARIIREMLDNKTAWIECDKNGHEE